jgi:primosomal protein N' (replication factor Y)
MLLSSATPSLESYQKALEGKYTLIRLTERYGKAKLPSVIISDMRREAAGGNLTPLGNLLTSKLVENKKKGNQSVLFINRRGYNNFVSCRMCGTTITCPHCSVAMTYHTKKNTYSEGELVCHWCGTRKPLPPKCPECGDSHLVRMGYGTQRIEEELENLLEGTGARILRMDTDTTGSKFAYDKMLGSFRDREEDILLGTQMVTEGHDFPGVTLVGVLLADASLYVDDYRASERTFSMLTQVIGRAGRGENEGVAIIQTNNPDNDVYVSPAIRITRPLPHES